MRETRAGLMKEVTMPIILGQLLLVAIIGYLWGSVPAGYWMGKLLRGKNFDIRDYGSHKTGATNVLRTLGKGPALIVFAFDLSKGVGPVLLAMLVPFLYVSAWGPSLAALAALVGHCYPIFIGFKGGRGVSTTAGALLVISPLAFIISGIILVVAIAATRYVSLGSILGCLSAIICGLVFYFISRSNSTFIGRVMLQQLLFMVLGPAFIIFLHYDNIGRLLAGTERKIGQKVQVEGEHGTTPTTTNNSSSNVKV
jgi:acyl phosphate:glycerol-3-phosphate acyltransferase